MKKVAIIMGSDSDLPTAEKAATELKKLEIPEVHVMSAHRTPDEASAFSKNAEENGFGVIISIAGMAAHLGGVLAANTVLPVIGVPVGSSFGGLDALLATVQMPSGIPVATVAINGGANAGLLAAKMLATSDDAILQKLKEYSKELKEQVQAKDARLQEVGYQNY